MEWVKLSARPPFYLDGDLLRAGEAAEVLFLRGLAHCGSVESGGRIDKTVLPMLVQTKAQARANALCREGLWTDEGDHYAVRSWDKHQDQHDIEVDRRRSDRDRKRKERENRKRDADMSQDSPVTSRGPVPVTSRGQSDDVTPLEVEVEVEVEKDTPPRPPAADPDGFAEFWAAYPAGKNGRGGRIAAVKAYRKALKTTNPAVILLGAVRFRDQPGRSTEYTPHASSWLNAGRWDDEPARALSIAPDWRDLSDAERQANAQARRMRERLEATGSMFLDGSA